MKNRGYVAKRLECARLAGAWAFACHDSNDPKAGASSAQSIRFARLGCLFAFLAFLSLAPRSQAQDNRPSGTVVSWGEKDLPYVEPGTRFTAIAAGAGHTAALKNDGSVNVWGGGGQNTTMVPEAAKTGAVAIAAGNHHTVALKSDGSVVMWGNNNQGQTTVPLAAQSGVVAISAGVTRSIALKSDGSIVAWGIPGEVPIGLPPAFAVAAGDESTLALVLDPAPQLTILQNPDQTASLSWTGAGALEQTESLTAPNWQPAPNQANPQTLSTTDAMKFYRVKAD